MKVTFSKFCVAILVLLSPVAFSQATNVITATLTGYEEVPAVSTVGKAQFVARISNDEQSIQWTMSYTDLEGGMVQQSHIHVGQPGVNGAISVFLCTNLGNGPVGTQACPQPPASGSF